MNNDKDARDMADLAFGGSSAVSGDASESRHERGARQAREADEESRATALASQASPAKRGSAAVMLRCVIDEMRDQAADTGHFDLIDDWADRLESTLAQSAPREKLAGAVVEAAIVWYNSSHKSEPEHALAISILRLLQSREALALHAQTVPQVPAGQGQYFDAFLCRAWGETDLPTAEIVADLAGVRRFMVREWWGEENPTEYGSNENMGDRIMGEIAEHDWREEGDWSATFEIGGVSVERITGFASLQPEAAGAAQPSEVEALISLAADWEECCDQIDKFTTDERSHGESRGMRVCAKELREFAAARTPTDAGGKAV